ELVFKLHDTYGFPADLTADIARERNLTIDLDGYHALMEEQKSSGAGAAFSVDYTRLNLSGRTEFDGYEHLALTKTQVTALMKDGVQVEQLVAGDEGAVVLNQTPFYANAGGQVGDSGLLVAEGLRFEVTDCRKSGESYLHIGRLISGSLSLGQALDAQVDPSIRQATALNHSATHLLHAALRQVLGDHVSQKGSSVDAEKLRFDFSHFEAVTPEQLKTIEAIINTQIRLNTPITTDICDMATAKTRGAMALFGEKYGDTVRVLTMGNGFSVELCGGTHASRTGDIGLLRIVSEGGVAAGVRRIEAVTGQTALHWVDRTQQQLQQAAALLKTGPDQLLDKLEALVAQNRHNEKALAALKGKLAAASANEWVNDAIAAGGVQLLVKQLETGDGDSLLQLVDQLKNKLGEAIVLLAGVEDGKVTLVAGASKAASAKVKAGDLVKLVAELLGGKGGGRPDMARGAGSDNGQVPQVLEKALAWLQAQLGN
ncbi:MAG TPA: alanine--tRNA ligase, partial [Cellvibrionaceae bacterium]|nr:alanine--tRNA ligase [Cellvibrionaceae bacterium]